MDVFDVKWMLSMQNECLRGEMDVFEALGCIIVWFCLSAACCSRDSSRLFDNDSLKEGVGLVVHFPLEDVAKINTP